MILNKSDLEKLQHDFKLKRQIIMEHYLHPTHRGTINQVVPYLVFSNYCIDNASIYLKVKDQVIETATFEGHGCAIFIASIDLMLELITNKSLTFIQSVLMNYYNLIHQESPVDEQTLGQLLIFNHLKAQPNRLNCGQLIHSALSKMLFENNS